MTANDQLRHNLRELMDWRRMTQAELADELHVSQPWVSKRMSGVTPFQIEDLDAIGKLFGLSPAELLQPGYGQWNRRVGTERRSGSDRRHQRRTPAPAPTDDDAPTAPAPRYNR